MGNVEWGMGNGKWKIGKEKWGIGMLMPNKICSAAIIKFFRNILRQNKGNTNKLVSGMRELNLSR